MIEDRLFASTWWRRCKQHQPFMSGGCADCYRDRSYRLRILRALQCTRIVAWIAVGWAIAEVTR